MVILKKVSKLEVLDEDGWIREGHPDIKDTLQELSEVDETNLPEADELIEKLRNESNYNGKQTPYWLQTELCVQLSAENSNPINVLRRFRQQYLFKVFLKEYYKHFGSSYLLDWILPNLNSGNRGKYLSLCPYKCRGKVFKICHFGEEF